MADATGHGIGPALSVTQVRSMLRIAVRMREQIPTIARYLNEQLHADLPEGRFITAWLAELDSATNGLTAFSAGQAPILHFKAASGEVEVMEADTLPFGIIDDLDLPTFEEVTIAQGDIVAVISDGVFEAMDPDDAQFGNDRVIDVIKRHHRESPAVILRSLKRAVEDFARGRPPADDQTVILIRRLER
jgi:phosphoserine phosphatase